MNAQVVATGAPRRLQIAVRLDHRHNTAIALLAAGEIDLAAENFRLSIHGRIDRAVHITHLFLEQLHESLAHPPFRDAALRADWESLVRTLNARECTAAVERVMSGRA